MAAVAVNGDGAMLMRFILNIFLYGSSNDANRFIGTVSSDSVRAVEKLVGGGGVTKMILYMEALEVER